MTTRDDLALVPDLLVYPRAHRSFTRPQKLQTIEHTRNKSARCSKAAYVVTSLLVLLVLVAGMPTAFASAAGSVSATATMTISGTEQRPNGIPDEGDLTVTVNGMTEIVHYGAYSSPASIAAGFAAQFSRDHIKDGLYAQSGANNNQDLNVITFQLTGGQAFGGPNVSGPTTSFAIGFFSGFGSGSGSIADTGTVTLQVSGTTVGVANYGSSSTAVSIAQDLASQTNSLVTVTANGSNLQLLAKQPGSASNLSYSLSGTSSNPSIFPIPSFGYPTVSGTLSGGMDANTQGSTVYSFSVTNSSGHSGYDVVNNVASVADSVMGTWQYGYDTLNRLTSGTAAGGPYNGQSACWAYDSYGNRTSESISGASCASSPVPTSSAQYGPDNKVSSASNLSQGYTYDGAGNVTNDGVNTYLYDAESRLCAVHGSTGMVGYQYDAEGNRVGKGSITSMVCDLTANGYIPMTEYVLNQNGDQRTEVSVGSDGITWQHTNVSANGTLLATFDNSGLHFHLSDSLGTRRAQTDAAGNLEQTCRSLPFGNGLTCTVSVNAPTEQHFTGKERDTESGLDYFGARYYASNMGRFMSPDYDDEPTAVPFADLRNPQTLNLYSYGRNNPLRYADPDGHDVRVCDNNGQCNTVGNDAYKAAQQGNNGGLNVPTLDQVGSNGNGSGQFNSTSITDGSGNSVGSATYVSNGGADYYANANGYNLLSNTSQVVKAGTAIYAGAYAGAFVAAGGLAAGGDLIVTGIEGDTSAIEFGKTAEQTAHALRHVVEEGLNPQEVQAAIKADIVQNGGVNAGSNTRYNAHRLASGAINVGKIVIH